MFFPWEKQFFWWFQRNLRFALRLETAQQQNEQRQSRTTFHLKQIWLQPLLCFQSHHRGPSSRSLLQHREYFWPNADEQTRRDRLRQVVGMLRERKVRRLLIELVEALQPLEDFKMTLKLRKQKLSFSYMLWRYQCSRQRYYWHSNRRFLGNRWRKCLPFCHIPNPNVQCRWLRL